MIKTLEKIYWHDGIFVDLNISTENIPILRLSVDLYKSHEVPLNCRDHFMFIFKEIDKLIMNVDIQQLKDNEGFGNIDDVYISQANEQHKIQIHLMEGHISFYFKDVTMMQKQHS